MYQSSQKNYDAFPDQVKLVVEIAAEQGRQVEWLDKWSGYLYRIEGKLFGYGKVAKFPLNTAISRSICKDKALTYIVLEEAGMKVPEGDYFFRFDENYLEFCRNKGLSEAGVFAGGLGYPVFVKPNSLSMGKLCRKIYNEKDLVKHLEDIFQSDYIALVQRVMEGKEYRVVVLDGEIILCYKKTPPTVIGDGKTKLNLLLGDLKVDWNLLAKKGYNADSILTDGEELAVKDTANINSGGRVVEVVRNYPDKLRDFAKEITQVLDIRYCGIDIICSDLHQEQPYIVLEVNADPGFDAFMQYDRRMTKEVFRRILDACFV